MRIRRERRTAQSLEFVANRGGMGWPGIRRLPTGRTRYRVFIATTWLVPGARIHGQPDGSEAGLSSHFQHEEHEEPTEKSNSALRAKRLKLPEHASGTAKPLLPETFVILRGSFVVSVLRFSNRNGAGDNHCAPSAVPRLLAPQYPYSYNKKTRRLNTPSSPDRHEACLPL
jgi:hypothetical protein